MSISKGYKAIAAVKVASAWGTPVAVGALNGVEYLSESISTDTELIEDMQVQGNVSTREGDAGNHIYGGDLAMNGRYEGIEPLIAMAFGGTSAAGTQVPTTNAYTHVFKTNNSLEGVFGTLVIDKQVSLFEYTTFKVVGFDFKCGQGKRAEITFKIACQDMNQNTSSGTNTNTTFANVTYPVNRSFLLFSQMQVRVFDQTGIALGAAHKVYVSEFSMSLENNMSTDDVTTQFGNLIDEPVRDGFATVKGQLVFSKYTDTPASNDALFAAQLTKTAKKMDVIFTGPAVSTGVANMKWSFFFPNIQFSKGTPQVPGAARVPLTMDFTSSRVTTAPTGFTAGYIDPLTLEIVSSRSTNPFT